jgi:chromosome segregation ATPase
MEPPQNEENISSPENNQVYQPRTAEEIKSENIQRLNKNAEKLRELENQMESIEKQIEEIKLKTTKNKIDEKISQEEINKLYQETLKIYEEYNKSLKERVNDKFIDVFDEIAGRIYDSQKKREELEDKKYDLTETLKEFQKYAADDEEREKKIDNDIANIKSEYEYLNKNYDNVSKENIELNKQIQQKNNVISDQRKKINELRGVIGKLTEVRVILNKYFSSHFENFTAQEKEIIKSVNNYRITDPEKYNLAMNQLLDSKEYGLGYMDDRSKSLNKASNLNNVGDSINNQRDMGTGVSKITDVNKSMDMSGAANQETK